MGNINRAVVSGNLTRDFELRSFGEDGQVANGGIAINRSYKKDGEFVKEVSFLDLTVWGNFGGLCSRKLRKGDAVTATGYLKQETWDKDGEKRSKIVLIVDDIDSEGFFRTKDEENAPGEASQATEATSAEPTDSPADDDIPF